MRVASIGECMVEVARRPDGGWAPSFGGDTLNTAVYLARLGVAVDYATALGDDPFSDEMLAAWQAEGVGTGLVRRLPGRLPGLYVIRTDGAGERSFFYWRSEAAARDLFAGEAGAALGDRLAGYDWLYFSGITLAVLRGGGREQLLAAVDRAREAGARVAFDGNFRPRGWPDRDEARHWFAEALRRTDLALPSADDEAALFGAADPEAAARRLAAAGAREVVVKLGAEGCLVAADGRQERVAPAERVRPVDTTAAGDSFNAAYLAARIAGLAPLAAARRGNRLAGAVVRHPGAIMPRAAMPLL